MKYILLMLIILGSLPGVSQDSTPIYSHDNLNIRNYIILHNNKKLLIKVQSGTQPLKVMLMNKENLVIDTLGIGSKCYAYHSLANNTIIGEGHRSTMLLGVKNKKLVIVNIYESCSSGGLGYIVQFNDEIVGFVQTQLKKGRKKYELLSMNMNNECFIREGGNILFEKVEKAEINKKLITSLPVTYGLSYKFMHVFIRDLQLLQTYTREFELTNYQLPVSTEWVWSFFFDSYSQRSFFVKNAKDDIKLFVKENKELVFLQNIQQIPEQIFNSQLVFCIGDSDKNCDYYSEKIKYID